MKQLWVVMGESTTEGYSWSDDARYENKETFLYQVWAENAEEVERIIDEKHPNENGHRYTRRVEYRIAETLGTPD